MHHVVLLFGLLCGARRELSFDVQDAVVWHCVRPAKIAQSSKTRFLYFTRFLVPLPRATEFLGFLEDSAIVADQNDTS